MATTPVFLPIKSHGQKSLAGCSPWGHKESDPTELIHTVLFKDCLQTGVHFEVLEVQISTHERGRTLQAISVFKAAILQIRVNF